MQSSECDERIESFTSPPYFITPLNLKCGCTLHGSTVEPQYNEPLYNEVLRMTNDFVYPSDSKIDEKEPRYNESSLQRKHFASPLAFCHVEVPLYKLRTQFLSLLLETGLQLQRQWSNAGQRQNLHCLVVLRISTVTVIKPATSNSTVKRSTDFPWNMPIVLA